MTDTLENFKDQLQTLDDDQLYHWRRGAQAVLVDPTVRMRMIEEEFKRRFGQ